MTRLVEAFRPDGSLFKLDDTTLSDLEPFFARRAEYIDLIKYQSLTNECYILIRGWPNLAAIGIGTQVYSTMVQLGFLQVGSETDPGIETGFAGTLLGYNTFTDYWSNRKLFSDEMVFLTKDGKTYRWALELMP